MCYAVARQNLRLGLDVVADTVNPIHITRQAWRSVAESLDQPYAEIEVICSDASVHRHRVESRETDIPGFALPTWEQVRARRYEAWDRERLVIDTAHATVAESLNALMNQLDRLERDAD
ncbi:hypothetical protein [Paenibacillus sp. UNC496MF]|uniref:AAA family ATPase n=1 Tax=Paenibacillus sp. UNC496MF TaxID=1502753 RepID=UPI000A7E24F4|nr:hypothetical protein [Paenibacillus sp. UNC496MF]